MNVLRSKFLWLLVCIAFVTCIITPQIASAHALNGTLTGKYNYSVERWRPAVIYYLKKWDVYTKEREGRILNIIKHESGGDPHNSRNYPHVGLVQFKPDWDHNYSRAFFEKRNMGHYHVDNRKSGRWSIWRIAKVYNKGGVAKIKQHWGATYYK